MRCFLNSASIAGLSPALQRMVEAATNARLIFEENFTPHRVIAEPGLLTAYFEPVLRGSRQRSALYSVPFYRRPPDLDALPDDHPLREANLTAGRLKDGAFEPYFTRGEIKGGALAGQRS